MKRSPLCGLVGREKKRVSERATARVGRPRTPPYRASHAALLLLSTPHSPAQLVDVADGALGGLNLGLLGLCEGKGKGRGVRGVLTSRAQAPPPPQTARKRVQGRGGWGWQAEDEWARQQARSSAVRHPCAAPSRAFCPLLTRTCIIFSGSLVTVGCEKEAPVSMVGVGFGRTADGRQEQRDESEKVSLLFATLPSPRFRVWRKQTTSLPPPAPPHTKAWRRAERAPCWPSCWWRQRPSPR